MGDLKDRSAPVVRSFSSVFRFSIYIGETTTVYDTSFLSTYSPSTRSVQNLLHSKSSSLTRYVLDYVRSIFLVVHVSGTPPSSRPDPSLDHTDLISLTPLSSSSPETRWHTPRNHPGNTVALLNRHSLNTSVLFQNSVLHYTRLNMRRTDDTPLIRDSPFPFSVPLVSSPFSTPVHCHHVHDPLPYLI